MGHVNATAALGEVDDEGVGVAVAPGVGVDEPTGGELLPPPPPQETSGMTISAIVIDAPKRASEVKVEPPYCR